MRKAAGDGSEYSLHQDRHQSMTSKPCSKPLLEWIKSGDPDLVPIVMADGRSTAASCLGVPVRTEGVSQSFTAHVASPVSAEMVLQCSRETGIHFQWSLGNIGALDVIPFLDDIDLSVEEQTGTDGVVRKVTTVSTPAGEMSDLFETPPSGPACWREQLVKGDADLPAFTCLIESACRAFREDARVRRYALARYGVEAGAWPPHVLLSAVIGVPAFTLTCALYMAPTTAVELLFDHKAGMERLFEAQALINSTLIDCAAEAGADFVLHAINGLEIFSPAIYREYFIPQAVALHGHARTRGLKTWVHTCGFMAKLTEMGAYESMDLDVVESLSPPPLGDLTDLKAGRARIGAAITTRGAVGVDQFYAADLGAVRERVRYVLESTRGYRHMVGDTNDSYPPYPRENILAVVDEVRKSGRLLPADQAD